MIGEELFPQKQDRITEQAKCTYSPFGKAFGKQVKTIKEQIQVLQSLNFLIR